jgi:cardiolipin synthase
MWAGDPARHLDPWRDTGTSKCAVPPSRTSKTRLPMPGLPPASRSAKDCSSDWRPRHQPWQRGQSDDGVRIRVVATVTAGLFRVDQLVAALARRTLWLTDAYYAGTTPYVQALRAAAQDGVDVRLLVPGVSDIQVLRPLSRAGYRPLLEAGIRVFEWNGTMLHAKTAVADGTWARVGSTNLNLASWLGNREPT